MTDGETQSIDLVKSFFAAKERHDLAATVAGLADDVQYVFPLSASGDPEPWFVYNGKDATTEYQRETLQRFSQIRMLDQEYTASGDGASVFVESHGDYRAADDGPPYTNVYIFKFQIRDGKIVRVYEYANPVTFAKFAGLPIG